MLLHQIRELSFGDEYCNLQVHTLSSLEGSNWNDKMRNSHYGTRDDCQSGIWHVAF